MCVARLHESCSAQVFHIVGDFFEAGIAWVGERRHAKAEMHGSPFSGLILRPIDEVSWLYSVPLRLAPFMVCRAASRRPPPRRPYLVHARGARGCNFRGSDLSAPAACSGAPRLRTRPTVRLDRAQRPRQCAPPPLDVSVLMPCRASSLQPSRGSIQGDRRQDSLGESCRRARFSWRFHPSHNLRKVQAARHALSAASLGSLMSVAWACMVWRARAGSIGTAGKGALGRPAGCCAT